MAIFRPLVLRSLQRSFREAAGKKGPILAGHKLLYRCNLECKMCPFWRREDEVLLTVRDEIRVMDALVRAGVSFLGFEGGEPTLRKDLPAILKESHERFDTSLVTNGWLLKQRIRDLYPHLEHLFVSLDGIGVTHDGLRGIDGSFARAVEGIKVAKEYVSTAISSTVTKDNLDDAEKVVELAEQLGVPVTFGIAYDYSTADAMSPGAAGLRTTIERLLELKKAGAPIMESTAYFESVINSWYNGIKWRCKPWLTINIDPSGRIVMPCYVLQEYSGQVPAWDVDILEMWNSFEWEPYEACNKCALACYLEPSLFSFTSPEMLRDRVIRASANYVRRGLRGRRAPAPAAPTGRPTGAG